jgi:hypothetical protein
MPRRRRDELLALIVTSVVLGVEGRALAAGGAATDAYEGIDKDATVDVHGLADVYFQQAWPQPSSGRLAYRAFDVREGVPSLSLLRVTLAHDGERFGFRADLALGDTANAYLRSDPAATAYPDLSRGLSYIEQLFVTVVVPIGKTSIDIGKFQTPVGLEDNENPSNWNYTRGLLFTLAEPTYHAGARVTTELGDTFAISAFWLNGWNANVAMGSGLRSFAVAASWKPSDALDVDIVYAGGLERPLQQPSGALSFRNLVNGNATYKPDSHVSLALTGDYAYDGGDTFWGVGGYVRWAPLSWLAGVVRAEHFEDPDGFVTGTAQQIVEATGTIEVRKKFGCVTTIARLEARRDQSDVHAFDGTRRDTLALGLMASF